jgi:hypothetical protein
MNTNTKNWSFMGTTINKKKEVNERSEVGEFLT